MNNNIKENHKSMKEIKKEKKREKKQEKLDSKQSKPKRATTAYFYFLERRRAELKSQGKLPEGRCSEAVKIIAAEWGGMTDSDKREFNLLAEKDRTRYENELNEHNADSSKNSTNKRKLGDISRVSDESNESESLDD